MKLAGDQPIDKETEKRLPGEQGRFSFGRKRLQTLAGWLFLLPSLVLFIVFVAVPAIGGLTLTLFRWDLISPARYVGVENFQRFLELPRALASLQNTIVFVSLAVPASIALGLLLALLLNEIPWGSTLFRTIFFAPVVATIVATSFVWRQFYAIDSGFFNYALSFVGIEPIAWLADPSIAIVSVAIMQVWHSAGFNMLIYLAGLQSIDPVLYESARMDGASSWTIFWKITLPMVSPVTFFLVIISVIGGLQAFEVIFVLTAGGPGYATTTLVYFIVEAAFDQLNMGLAATISLVLFVLIMVVTLIQWKIQDRWVHYA